MQARTKPVPDITNPSNRDAEFHVNRIEIQNPPLVLKSKQPPINRHELCILAALAVFWWPQRSSRDRFPSSSYVQRSTLQSPLYITYVTLSSPSLSEIAVHSNLPRSSSLDERGTLARRLRKLDVERRFQRTHEM